MPDGESRRLKVLFELRRNPGRLLDLSRLEGGRGHAAEAEALRRQAREVVEFIAGNISDSELRASFLSLEGVQATDATKT